MHDEYMVKGYQWGSHGQFIGEYNFPANKDQYAIHMPPNTTLIEPPRNLPVDQEAAWDGAKWVVRNVQLDWMPDMSSYGENFFGTQTPEAVSDTPETAAVEGGE